MPYLSEPAQEPAVEIIDKQSLYQGFFQLNRYILRYRLFDGSWSAPVVRELFERGHAVGVLLVDLKDESLVLVEQFRPGALETEAKPWLLELVAGVIEPGEMPESVAYRETQEEAGCQITRMRKIAEYLVSPGGSTERIWLYAAEVDAGQLQSFGGLADEHEDIKIHKIPVATAFDMLEKGLFANAMALIAMQWLKLHWQKRGNFFDD